MITIGITDCSKYQNYFDWFASDDVKVIKLSSKENNVEAVDTCNGIVLSGGEDVHPKYYGHAEWMEKKDELKLHVNEARDEFEMRLIDRAVKSKKPILGICRGLQIMNVYFKGTLIPDLKPHLNPPLQGGLVVHRSKKEGHDPLHNIQVEKDSGLFQIISVPPPEGGSWRGASWLINSAHHQAADKIGDGLTVSARAKDGTVEAIEWSRPNRDSKQKNPKNKPFLLLVQWHPERIKEQQNPFSKNIKEKFLQSLSLRERK